MKARVIKNFQVNDSQFKKGDILYLDGKAILLYGDHLCYLGSPFADEYFEIVTDASEQLTRNDLKNMKARVIKAFHAQETQFKAGDVFYLRDESILLFGKKFCDVHGSFAAEHFEFVQD